MYIVHCACTLYTLTCSYMWERDSLEYSMCVPWNYLEDVHVYICTSTPIVDKQKRTCTYTMYMYKCHIECTQIERWTINFKSHCTLHMYMYIILYLDGSVTGPSSKPLVARLHCNAAHPAQVTTDHTHQLPGRVPVRSNGLHGSTWYQLLSSLTEH